MQTCAQLNSRHQGFQVLGWITRLSIWVTYVCSSGDGFVLRGELYCICDGCRWNLSNKGPSTALRLQEEEKK